MEQPAIKASLVDSKAHPGSSPSNRISRNLLKRAVSASNARSANGATQQQGTNFLASELGGTVSLSTAKLRLRNAVHCGTLTKLGGKFAVKRTTAGKSGRTRRLGRKVKVSKSGSKSSTRRARKSSGGRRRKSAKRTTKKKGKKAGKA